MATVTQALERYDEARARAFARRDALSVPVKWGLALGMAAATGLVAQVRIPLPFTPVPITGQVFAVLLAGVLLGGRYGALSQIIYLAAGSLGVPWFAGWTAGSLVQVGVTAGYLVGFIPAAFLVGIIVQKWNLMRYPLTVSFVMLLGVAVIYACGAPWVAVVTGADLRTTLALGVMPFIAVDMCKALLAAMVAAAVLPKER